MGVRTRGLDIAINAKRQVAAAAARAEAKGAVIERWNEQVVASVGEIGITGTAGAVANALWLATGIRVRKFPIALDRLIEPHS
jgi:CO/xanthine dehydrogenase Mo-binding subunit